MKLYVFKTKDPIIDILRTLVQVETSLANTTQWRMLKRIEEGTGVGASTLYSWFSGPTISPRYCSVAAVALFLGVDITIGSRKAPRKSLVRRVA